MATEDTESLPGLLHRDWLTGVKKALECGEETLLWWVAEEPFPGRVSTDLHLSTLAKVDVTGDLHTVLTTEGCWDFPVVLTLPTGTSLRPA